MKYEKIIKGQFVKRLNRFVALCLVDGEEVYCHVKNTGRCGEILVEGAECFLEESPNPERKYKYSLVTLRKGERLINIDSQAPNKAMGEFLKSGRFFSDISNLRAEKSYGNSRFDFYFEHAGNKAFLEVKGVTLEKNSAVFFPDAPTERGTKHLKDPFPPTIAIAVNARSPSLTALKSAVRSAQLVGVNAAFSILQPVYTLPSLVNSAAPTEKPE